MHQSGACLWWGPVVEAKFPSAQDRRISGGEKASDCTHTLLSCSPAACRLESEPYAPLFLVVG